MRPFVNTLPHFVERKEINIFWQSFVLIINILYILKGCFVNVLYCPGGFLSLPFLVGFDNISLS